MRNHYIGRFIYRRLNKSFNFPFRTNRGRMQQFPNNLSYNLMNGKDRLDESMLGRKLILEFEVIELDFLCL